MMAAIEMSIKDIEYDRLKTVLKQLQGLAEGVEAYEDDIFDDYNQIARYNMREIIDILLNLEL